MFIINLDMSRTANYADDANVYNSNESKMKYVGICFPLEAI